MNRPGLAVKLCGVSTTWKLLLGQGAAILGVLLVTLGLYTWGCADVFAQRGDRVVVAAWSVRCLGLAAIAGGQLLFALAVLPALFSSRAKRFGTLEQGLALATGLLALLSLVAGGALAAAAGW